ncbi:coiled-coil domain-containing protein 77-like isoform X2 [Watersipora subatra]|uniref:coiled-coil domain-containing protein 77-like isoform X2 n=1 Tax=Watersipora subatra TaxID=2589382 RepID=UPI00355B9145
MAPSTTLPTYQTLLKGWVAYLKPSRELLEFYRKKFAEQECEHETLVERLEDYKTLVDKQHTSEWGLRQREEEMVELQKALSDMQISLFQEREQVLRLYSENDRYKIQDLGSKRIIKKLLEESNQKVGDDEPVELLPGYRRKGDKATLSRSAKADGYRLVLNSQAPGEADRLARVGLSQKIEELQRRLEMQAREYKEQIESRIQERQRLADEYSYVCQRDFDKVKTATEKLHKTQELLYLSTQDLLTLQQEAKGQERHWMVQKDKLLRELDSVKEQLNIDQPTGSKKVVLNVSDKAGDNTRRQQHELEKLRDEVVTAHNLREMYREQLVTLEDELARLREQDDLRNDDFQDKVSKVGKRYQLMKTRFEELEKRRNLEISGYKSDVKALRKRVKEMQQQMFKVKLAQADSLLDDDRPTDLDLEVLKNIKTTAKRSTQLSHGLKDMKIKLHNLEQLVAH